MTDFPLMAGPNIATMAAALRKNCIEYVLKGVCSDQSSSLYVTEFAFPYWIRLSSDEKFISLNTYIETSDGVSDDEYLELANRLNDEFLLIQFHFDRDLRRLSGVYMVPARSGVTEPQFLVLARLFPGIFAEATASRNARGELVPSQAAPCQLIVIEGDP
ncbi:MAG: hypothetical protein GW858_14080 [Sphingomonadales bacterium]|nr:hypothetical protein [Sphingomonadales bacterium]NCQ21601.1 hypothetical protein [Sphingomonadales bacterium]NCT04683.1 hypothetical protein [Sphingomonadales bacterium]